MCSECSGKQHLQMSRQDFLKLGGAGISGVAVLGLMGSGHALAQTGSSLTNEFEEAAQEYDVPVELLLAVGYANARWIMPPPGTGEFEPGEIHGMGGYGLMQLSEDPELETLDKAAELTGISGEDLKTDRRSNILGGAAVLADAQSEADPGDINGWYDAVADTGGGVLFANQVYEILEEGASTELPAGEEVVLEPQEEAEQQEVFTAQAQGDYRRSTFYGANSNNFTRANRPSSNRIDKIIIHITEGSWSSAINWFKDSRAQVSAHYVVRSRDGFIGQSVREKDIAWHSGDWNVNQTSIGIEHEGYGNNSKWLTAKMYNSSARLSAYLCRKYRIPINRSHFLGHKQISATSCPGRHWDWNRYIRLVKKYANSGNNNVYRQVVDNASKRFRASRAWKASSWNRQRFGKNYRYTTPRGVNDFATFRIRVPRRGRYAIFARWPADPGYNNRTRFLIRTSNGWVRRVVNQRKRGGRWVRLGVFNMDAGDRRWIRIPRRSPSKGYIIADAVMIRKA